MSADVHAHADGEAHPHYGGDEGKAPSVLGRRSTAIQELLVEKGILAPDELARKWTVVDSVSVANGGRIVARAWLVPEFRQRLITDANAVLAEIGYTLPADSELTVVENTDNVHHLVVCTLCSCYPNWLLGRPPDWYKSMTYRTRAVTDPRGVLREFGLELAEDVEMRVVDSTADLRYMVLPRRPSGTEGLNEEELASLITRDSLIGVADPLSPSPVLSVS